MGEIKAHKTLMGLHDSLVNLEVCRGTRKGLNVDTPFVSGNTEGIESALLAESLDAINVLVTTVITGARIALGIFVAHGSSQGIKNRLGGQVLRGNKNNGFTLTGDFIINYSLNFRIKVNEAVLE